MKQRRIRCLAAAAFVLLFLGAAWFTGCDLSLMWSRRDHLTDIAAKMFPPDWGFLGKVLPLLWATIQMSITGTFLGAVLSIPAAMACAAALPGPGPVKKAVRFCIQVLRSFPALILALLATFFLGIGSFAGTAAITVYTFAIMTRLTYEDIESAPQGPYLALRAMGAASAQAFFRSTLPEILPAYLTNALYLLEGNVRHSAILGYVGAGGIGLLLNEKVSWREYDKVGTILLLLFAVVYLMEHLSTWLTRLVQQERTLGRQGRRLLAGAAALTGQNARGALRIWRRDRRNHASPNSAQTESACAGALNVQLAGPAYYFGQYYPKPTIGDAVRPIEPEDIRRADRMMYAESLLALALGLVIRGIL